jgi:pyruvate/2-oxoglutarate dehydrogenase complex dihydrolipoamide acyltransferase (E2) component
MATNIVMPQLGESVVEGTVGKWFKQVGDKIEQYEPVMEVITDKVTTEIPSPASGKLLQIIVPEGVTVKAGTVLAVIGAPGEPIAAPVVPSVAVPTAAPAPIAQSPSRPIATRLTPVVARMIAENDITDAELATIRGTGDGGRVSKKDIENFLKTRVAAPPTELPPWEQPGTGELFRPTEEVFGKPTSPLPPSPVRRGDGGEVIPLSPIRKAIAEHMVRSKQIAPHVTTVHEADMSRVIAFQKAHGAEFEKRGVKLTYTAFFVQAVVAALEAFPIVNASYAEQGIVMKRDLNIGIAVAIDDGLIVPVLKNADEKSLLGFARAVNDLATRAREKRLQPDEVQGGTFTITNYGIFGSLFGTPIINQPQVAILATGTIEKRPVVRDDAIAIRTMCYFCLTFDHRLVDGADADRFMALVKTTLQEFDEAAL